MLDSLKNKLQDAIDKVTRAGYVDKDVIDALVTDLQRAFIEADVDVSLVDKLSEKIRARSLKEKPVEGVTAREHVIKIVYDELVDFLGKEKPTISLNAKKILLCGLFGSGKTTTAAKLAKFYKEKGLKVGLVCADVVRPAAFEQLQQLARQIDVPFYGEPGEKDASKVVTHALRKMHNEIMIVDSSGRDALDDSLVKEIKKIDKAFVPDETILVIPADIGQAAFEQARAFHDALGITDVIVSKMDSTAKGGAALTACNVTGAKVMFIGVGEYVHALEIYDPQRFVARLLGFPDLATLLDKAKKLATPESEKKAKKIISGDFTIGDFIEQMGEVKKVGSFSSIIEGIGLGKKLNKNLMDSQEKKMEKWKHIANSMTPAERNNAELIDLSRIRRVAKGAGVQESDVRELVANYKKIKKAMHQLSPGKMKRSQMGQMMRQMGMKF
ncbi:MAG: signal recognition particle receptor subunit alpha [Candidatus Aenigmatarchaeota archaeon]